jgi:aldose 1-epimerase
LQGFLQKNDPYFGAVIGRVANRIGGAKFTLYGVQYNVTPNEGPNQLHGGLRGFDKVCIVKWKIDSNHVQTAISNY